jgi:hypothetical protein
MTDWLGEDVALGTGVLLAHEMQVLSILETEALAIDDFLYFVPCLVMRNLLNQVSSEGHRNTAQLQFRLLQPASPALALLTTPQALQALIILITSSSATT